MQTGAAFSPCRQYRYALWRLWDNTQPSVLFIALNPSTASETHNDPTIRRCIGFARAWGYGGVYVANLFAYRATQPKLLKEAPDPIGPDNDPWLRDLAAQSNLIVAAWGNHGSFQSRSIEVLPWLPAMQCLGITKQGQPKHPLYLRREQVLERFRPTHCPAESVQPH